MTKYFSKQKLDEVDMKSLSQRDRDFLNKHTMEIVDYPYMDGQEYNQTKFSPGRDQRPADDLGGDDYDNFWPAEDGPLEDEDYDKYDDDTLFGTMDDDEYLANLDDEDEEEDMYEGYEGLQELITPGMVQVHHTTTNKDIEKANRRSTNKANKKRMFSSLFKKKKVSEEKMSQDEVDEKERLVKGMKKNTADFKKRYGDKWKSVMYATANKKATEGVDMSNKEYVTGTFELSKPMFESTQYKTLKNVKIYLEDFSERYQENFVNHEDIISLLDKGWTLDEYKVDYRNIMTESAVNVGDRVHLGFGAKGGAGFKGKVTKIDGNMCEIESNSKTKYGPKTYRGPMKYVTKMEEEATQDKVEDIHEQVSAGNMNLKSGENVTVSSGDAKTLNSFFESLSGSEKKQMMSDLMKSKTDFSNVLKFAKGVS